MLEEITKYHNHNCTYTYHIQYMQIYKFGKLYIESAQSVSLTPLTISVEPQVKFILCFRPWLKRAGDKSRLYGIYFGNEPLASTVAAAYCSADAAMGSGGSTQVRIQLGVDKAYLEHVQRWCCMMIIDHDDCCYYCYCCITIHIFKLNILMIRSNMTIL